MDLSSLGFFCVLAQVAEPVQESHLSWMFRMLGPFYGLLIPAIGFVVFVGACVVVAKCRRPGVIASYLVFLPLPFLVGLFGCVDGLVASYSVIAMSAVTPKPNEVALGMSMGLVSLFMGLVAMLPAYLVLAFGLFVRTISAGKSQTVS